MRVSKSIKALIWLICICLVITGVVLLLTGQIERTIWGFIAGPALLYVSFLS